MTFVFKKVKVHLFINSRAQASNFAFFPISQHEEVENAYLLVLESLNKTQVLTRFGPEVILIKTTWVYTIIKIVNILSIFMCKVQGCVRSTISGKLLPKLCWHIRTLLIKYSLGVF